MLSLTLDGHNDHLYMAISRDNTVLGSQFISGHIGCERDMLQLIHLLLRRCQFTEMDLSAIFIAESRSDVAFYCQVAAEGIALATGIPVQSIPQSQIYGDDYRFPRGLPS